MERQREAVERRETDHREEGEGEREKESSTDCV